MILERQVEIYIIQSRKTNNKRKKIKMINKRQWEEMTRTDKYHLLKLEDESYLGYQLQRLYYFFKHLIIRKDK
jgi:hypothetical protein